MEEVAVKEMTSENEEVLEEVLKRLGVYSWHRKDHHLALMLAVVKNMGWHETEVGLHFGIRLFENESHAEDWILKAIEMEKKGDDGTGPCWSKDQRTYARTLYFFLPKLVSEFPQTLEFYKEGYHDADGIAYDLGVKRDNNMRRAVTKERDKLRDRIRTLEGFLRGHEINGLLSQLKKVSEALEGARETLGKS